MPESSSKLQPQSMAALSDGNVKIGARHAPPQDNFVDKEKKPISPHVSPNWEGPLQSQQLKQELLR